MNKERWRQIKAVFSEASELPLAERRTFLANACKDDPELLPEVERLLAADEMDDPLLETPRWDLGLSVLADNMTGRTFGKFRIISEIGRGGMGEVYAAEDTLLRRRVALKLLSPLLTDQSALSRFRLEARAASAVSHPNITHIYEIGEENGRLFIAMELVDGVTLREHLADLGKLEIDGATVIGRQVASALAAAHARGIVHRDIKPENIIIMPDGVVKVVDFGLAKLTEEISMGSSAGLSESSFVNTDPRMVIGTVTYMSPEQARGQDIDERTDIWSWGVVFFEMLSGTPPFTGASRSDVVAEILKSEPELEQDHLSDDIRELLRTALQKDKDARILSASDVVARLDAIYPIASMVSGPHRIVSSGGLRRSSGQTAASGSSDILSKSSGWRAMSAAALVLIVVAAIAGVMIFYPARESSTAVQQGLSPAVTYLTRDGRIMDAAISADGKRLVYIPIDAGNQSIWIRDLETGEERQLLPPEPVRRWGARFTPDSASLLFIQAHPSSPTNVLYRIPLDEKIPVKVLVDIAGPPALSPDGMRVAFVRRNSANRSASLVTANIDGSSERVLATRIQPETLSDGSPSWSPDGKLIAVGAGRKSDAENAVLGYSLVSDAPVELTPWRWAAVGGMSWDNDGQTLVLSARPTGSRTYQLWKVGYPSGSVDGLLSDANAFEEVTLSSTRKSIVATHTYEVSDIWAVNLDGQSRRLSTQNEGGADGLAFASPDRIVYTKGEYEESAIWSMNIDGSDRKRLTPGNGFLPSVSRDGRFVAYVTVQDGVRHIRLVDTEGSNDRALTQGAGETSPSVSPDGLWLAYASSVKDRSNIWKIPIDGGEPTRLTGEGLFIKPAISPDGTMISCVYRRDQSDNWKVGIIPAGGGEIMMTFALPNARGQMLRWSSDSRGLIYSDSRDGADNLWIQPLDNSPARQLTNFTQDQILHHDFAPARGEYIISRGGRRRDIAMIKGY